MATPVSTIAFTSPETDRNLFLLKPCHFYKMPVWVSRQNAHFSSIESNARHHFQSLLEWTLGPCRYLLFLFLNSVTMNSHIPSVITTNGDCLLDVDG